MPLNPMSQFLFIIYENGQVQEGSEARILPRQQAKDMSIEKGSLRDIQDRGDLLLVMTQFYELMLADKELRPIFTDTAKIHLETHLPVLADFWEGILFGTGSYHNNPMAIHLDLHRKYPLSARHFELWLRYFNAAVDALFIGDTAHLMKTRALSIATVMQIKVLAEK